MPSIYGLMKFFVGFCIPAYHSMFALKTQNQHLIKIWLTYFSTVVFYELILSFIFDPIFRVIDPRLIYFKTLFVILYIFPETGFQESYLIFFSKYLNKLCISVFEYIKGVLSLSPDLPEETSLSNSPVPSIPEEGDIKGIADSKESISEGTTLAPSTPVGKINTDFIFS
ncbi:uncharacterized protein cubi_00018 [Cryptosporidium ubiquitum]|uniref:TB2/DP1, HVA22 family protein n=1 Tax=Cryptosporidium ubiquitum TaxID=857276 RepID=A0A1J4MJQ5_9CRYT|nr:uncharacterized protein cubi_00018 [Cryptosporidium ubiquitum]OII74465.1 hypothetical protein cubi_00018 [Cryptosporidium ubiquitum]